MQGSAEHMFLLHSVLSEEHFDEDVQLSDDVDLDNFCWDVVDERLHILECRTGLARYLLHKLKGEHNLKSYLQNSSLACTMICGWRKLFTR
jgi:hypothetical protein